MDVIAVQSPKANPSGASEESVRFAPCGFLSFKRSAFKKSAGISANKHAITCVTKRSRGDCIAMKYNSIEGRYT